VYVWNINKIPISPHLINITIFLKTKIILFYLKAKGNIPGEGNHTNYD
jgi:hypothetical protein